MRTFALGSIALLASFSFASEQRSSPEIVITVTSDRPAVFDLYQSLNSRETSTQTGLKTPFTKKLSSWDAKFIFRQKDENAKLKIDVSHGTIKLTADWPVTVVIVENDTMSTFGMN